MKREFRAPQKRKPKLAKTCQDCRKQPAVTIQYRKWYRNAPIGSYNVRYVSSCSDCAMIARAAGDVLPKGW